MSAKCRLAALGLGAAVLLLSLGCQCLFLIPWPPTDPLCAERPFSPPPSDFAEQDLVGTWQTASDEIAVDRLVIKPDGTFKQIYEERVAYVLALYRYETAWNHWWLERFADGRVRLHLEGARYYDRGTRFAELEGMGFGTDPLPWLFEDPFAHEYLEMVGKLVLNVRVDRRGELLLHHMTLGGDSAGFALTGCQSAHFRRVETP